MAVPLRGRPKSQKTERDYIRNELVAIARYAQFRLRGISYQIGLNEGEKELSLVISVPVQELLLGSEASPE